MATLDSSTPTDRVLDLVEERAQEVVDAVIDSLRAELPDFLGVEPGKEDPRVVEAVSAHVREHVTVCAAALRRGHSPAGRELDFVRVRALERAREGLPVDAMLHAYRIGQREVWKAIAGAAAGTAPGEVDLVELSFASNAYTNAVSGAVSEAYIEARQMTLADAERSRRELLTDLLSAGASIDGDLLRRAAALGLDAHGAHAMIVAVAVDPSHEQEATLRLAERAVARARISVDATPWSVIAHDELIGLVPCGERGAAAVAEQVMTEVRRLHEREGAAVRVGVSVARPGLTDVREAYTEARRAVVHTSAEQPVVAVEQVALFDYLVSDADEFALGLVPEALADLASGNGPQTELADTLLAYLECGLNAERAARRLFVHPNTVRYRLRRVRELTARDPHDPLDLLDLVTAIRLVRQQRAAGEWTRRSLTSFN